MRSKSKLSALSQLFVGWSVPRHLDRTLELGEWKKNANRCGNRNGRRGQDGYYKHQVLQICYFYFDTIINQ